MVIGDMGSVRPGVPTLTIGLRGMAAVIVAARTLAGPKHSGQFGGAAPTRCSRCMRALASLHDENGDVAVDGPPPRGVDGRVVQRRRVPRPRRGPRRAAVHRHRRARRADLVRPGDHRHRPRRAAGRRRAVERRRPVRPRQGQPRFHPEQDPARGPGRPDPPPRGAAAVRDRARGRGGRDRHGLLRRRRPGPAYDAARAALAAAWGSETVSIATGGSIPLVSALQEAVPERRDPAARHDRRLRQHPRAERARPARRVREGRRRRGRVLRRGTPRRGGGAGMSEAPQPRRRAEPAARADGAHPRRDRARRQQDAEPGDPVRLALRGRDRPLGGPRLGRHQRHLRGREAAARRRSRRSSRAARRSRPAVCRTRRCRRASTRSSRRRPRSRASISADGVRFIFTSFVANFRNFAAVAIILVVMIGVGLAEAAGLIGALIRKLVGVSSARDADADHHLHRRPLERRLRRRLPRADTPRARRRSRASAATRSPGMAAAFAGVAAGFGVNFLITPLDGVLTEITNDASALADPDRTIDLAANLYFGIASTIFITLVMTLVSMRIVEKRPRRARPGARERRRVARRRQGARGVARGRGAGLRYALDRDGRRARRDHAAHRASRTRRCATP